MTVWREIRTVEDAEAMRDDITEVVEGYYQDQPVDVDDVLRRLETEGPDGMTPDFGADMTSPAIRRVRAIAAEVKREMA